MATETQDRVSIIELPEDEYFLLIESDGANPRVAIRTNDIKAFELPHGDDLVVKIVLWNEAYTFNGRDAACIEEFLLSRKSYGGT
jgi:hypothetical protein